LVQVTLGMQLDAMGKDDAKRRDTQGLEGDFEM
jgi:hypothetical protein